MRDLKVIFYSKQNHILGDKIRRILYKLNCEISYMSDFSKITNFILSVKKVLIFVDKEYKTNLFFVSALLKSHAFNHAVVAYVDDDISFYEGFTNNRNLFVLNNNALESEVPTIISVLQVSNYNFDVDTSQLRDMISTYLIQLGFSYKHIGFQYIKQCVEYCVNKHFNLCSLNNDVYPHVALINNTCSINIERSIRNAINQASKNAYFLNDKYFKSKSKITNKHLLAYLIDKVNNNFDLVIKREVR